ncbi:hypothetical protein I553_6599 [Mycobacterium xenopi 4042]|uniref:Transcriptional regulator Rv0078-like C-terminal domain-containing protein n=1 Tax=Mycobacterium xenopi 4042 TaxID=1299334 RepID=X8BFU8_MYCXE|nr:hypothetical protein I553_6599 [Mycobacterium xenopi 4042]
MLQPELQRILIIDGPAVLGLARYTELDERYAFAVIVEAFRAATAAGTLRVDDPRQSLGCCWGAESRRNADRQLAAPRRNPGCRRAEHADPARRLPPR